MICENPVFPLIAKVKEDENGYWYYNLYDSADNFVDFYAMKNSSAEAIEKARLELSEDARLAGKVPYPSKIISLKK